MEEQSEENPLLHPHYRILHQKFAHEKSKSTAVWKQEDVKIELFGCDDQNYVWRREKGKTVGLSNC